TREVSRSRSEASAVFWPSVLAQAVGGVFVTTVSYLIVLVGARLSAQASPDLSTAALIAGCTSAARLLTDVPVAISRGLDRMHWEAAITAIERTLFLFLFVCVVLRFRPEITAVFEAGLASQLFIAAVSLVVATRLLFPHTPSWHTTRKLVFASLPLMVYGVLSGFHWRFDTIMLQHLAGEHEVGIFSAPFKLLEAFRALPWLLLMAAFPTLARQAKTDRLALRRSYTTAFRLVLLASIPIAILLYALAEPVVFVVFSRGFAESILPLRLLAVAIVPLCLNWLFNYMCLCVDRQNLIPWMYVAASIPHLAAAVLLVPRFGADGAAVSFLTAEIGLCIVGIALMTRCVAPVGADDLVRPIVSAAVASCVLFMLRGHDAIRTGIASVGAYCGALLILPIFARSRFVLSLFFLITGRHP
ncbi:MAG: oligosaccharide flippase family protein, partial [Armatimonadota bacterium]